MRRYSYMPALLFLAACGSSHDAAPSKTAPVSVHLATASEEAVPDTFEAGGVVRPRLRATIAARMMAPIESVHVTAGTRVKAGQTLIVLDARQVSSEAARAAAMVDTTRRGAEAAAAERQAAAAQLVLARKTHERVTALHASKSATQQELDQATAALASAEARASAAEAHALEAERAIAAATDAAGAASAVRSYATLTAPFDGIVTSRSADPGMLATPGTPLLQVETDDTFSLETTVDEAWTGRLAINAPVEVIVDAVSSSPLPGHVDEIARAIDPASHAVTVKIGLPRIAELRSGMFGSARLAGTSRRSVTVPEGAVIRRGQLSFVFVSDSDVARLRLVRTTPAAGGKLAIVSGLSAGEKYVAAPPADLRDGQPLAAKG